LIEAPVRGLSRLKRGHVLMALAVFAALAVAWAIGRQDGVSVAGQLAAERWQFALAVDLAPWLDMTSIALVIAATVRFREVIRLAAVQARQWARRCAGRLMATLAPLARGRAGRARGAPRPRHGEDPDRPAPGFAWA
jgi:hypothetical protein